MKRIIWMAWNYELKDRFIQHCNVKKRGWEGGGKEKTKQVNQNHKIMFNSEVFFVQYLTKVSFK